MSRPPFLVAVALLLIFADVAAQEAPPAPADRAMALSDEGLAAFRQRRYDDAIAAFAASYALSPLPALTFDIAQSYRLKGDCANALEHYRRYLNEAPDAPNRAVVEQQIGAMGQCAESSTAPAPVLAPVASPAPPKTPLVLSPAITAAPARAKPVTRRPWFWISIGSAAALAATGISVGVVYGRPPRYPAATIVVPGN
jgi:tetratricopeptide (TPR) repeat protein